MRSLMTSVVGGGPFGTAIMGSVESWPVLGVPIFGVAVGGGFFVLGMNRSVCGRDGGGTMLMVLGTHEG
jgi:hypothetical protein